MNVIYFDRCEALDVVTHLLFTNKLTPSGLHAAPFALLYNILLDRSFKVYVNHKTYDFYTATSGVPQVSVLVNNGL